MWRNSQETANLLIFTEEILNEKFHFLSSVNFIRAFKIVLALGSQSRGPQSSLSLIFFSQNGDDLYRQTVFKIFEESL